MCALTIKAKLSRIVYLSSGHKMSIFPALLWSTVTLSISHSGLSSFSGNGVKRKTGHCTQYLYRRHFIRISGRGQELKGTVVSVKIPLSRHRTWNDFLNFRLLIVITPKVINFLLYSRLTLSFVLWYHDNSYRLFIGIMIPLSDEMLDLTVNKNLQIVITLSVLLKCLRFQSSFTVLVFLFYFLTKKDAISKMHCN